MGMSGRQVQTHGPANSIVVGEGSRLIVAHRPTTARIEHKAKVFEYKPHRSATDRFLICGSTTPPTSPMGDCLFVAGDLQDELYPAFGAHAARV